MTTSESNDTALVEFDTKDTSWWLQLGKQHIVHYLARSWRQLSKSIAHAGSWVRFQEAQAATAWLEVLCQRHALQREDNSSTQKAVREFESVPHTAPYFPAGLSEVEAVGLENQRSPLC